MRSKLLALDRITSPDLDLGECAPFDFCTLQVGQVNPSGRLRWKAPSVAKLSRFTIDDIQGGRDTRGCSHRAKRERAIATSSFSEAVSTVAVVTWKFFEKDSNRIKNGNRCLLI